MYVAYFSSVVVQYTIKYICSCTQNNQRCAAYLKYMHSNGHLALIATEAGFIVHFDKCWLGASPDAWVTDPQLLVDDIGLAEFKCPYTKAFTTPERVCEDSEFCCVMVMGNSN